MFVWRAKLPQVDELRHAQCACTAIYLIVIYLT